MGARPAAPRRDWQSANVCLLLFLLGNGLLLFGIAQPMRDRLVQAFSIPSASMAPALQPGDMIFVDKRYNCPGCKGAVTRGDVGVFVYPNDRTLYYIKRVIGLPGDRIDIDGQTVSVNGAPLSDLLAAKTDGGLVTEAIGDRRWQVRRAPDAAAEAPFHAVVPAGSIFVLGDNRSDSIDSRTFGFVPLTDLVGKARQVWFSWNGGPQFDRIGRQID